MLTHLHPPTHTHRCGDLGLEMYIISKGSVGVIGKHNHMIGLLCVGQAFGEIALFTEVRGVDNSFGEFIWSAPAYVLGGCSR